MNPAEVAIGLIWAGEHVVVGWRPVGTPLAGLAEFPGGKCRLGEPPALAVVRECLEETGLEVVVLGLRTETYHAYDHGLLHLHFFDCRPCVAAQSKPTPPGTPFLPLKEPFRWVPLAELAAYPFPPANRAVLASLGTLGAHDMVCEQGSAPDDTH